MNIPPDVFIIIVGAVIGACIGSFMNVWWYRRPLGISVVYPPSSCPKCGERIKWYDNVPVFGWIFLGGKCRSCKNDISVRYPIIEFIFSLIGAGVGIIVVSVIL